MSIMKIPLAGSTFNTEQSSTLVPISVSAIAVSSAGIATVTMASTTGLQAGFSGTFTGVTPATYTTTEFVILQVLSATQILISTTLGAATLATATFVPIIRLRPGMYFMVTGPNALVQYNPDNTGYVDSGDILPSANVSVAPTVTLPPVVPQSVSGATWRTVVPASANDMVFSDFYGMRLIFSGSAGTTYWSAVK